MSIKNSKRKSRSSSKEKYQSKLNTSKTSMKKSNVPLQQESEVGINFMQSLRENLDKEQEFSSQQQQSSEEENKSVQNEESQQNESQQEQKKSKEYQKKQKKSKSPQKKLHQLTSEKLKEQGKWPNIEQGQVAASTSQNLKDPKYFLNESEVLEFLKENNDVPLNTKNLTAKQLKQLKVLQTRDGRFLVHDVPLFQKQMRLARQSITPKSQLYIIFILLGIFMFGSFLTLISDVYIILIITATNIFGLLVQEIITLIVKRKNKVGKSDQLKYLMGVTFLLLFFVLYLIDKSIDSNSGRKTGTIVLQALTGVLLSIGISQLGATRIEILAKDIWHKEDEDL